MSVQGWQGIILFAVALMGAAVITSSDSQAAPVDKDVTARFDSQNTGVFEQSTTGNRTSPGSNPCRWQIKCSIGVECNPVACGSTILVVDGDYLSAVDATTGQLKWRFPPTVKNPANYRTFGGSNLLDSPIGTPAVSRGVVCCFSGNNTLNGIDLQTGKSRWSVKISDPVNVLPVVANGILFVGTPLLVGLPEARPSRAETYAIAVDVATGKVLWKAASTYTTGFPAVADGIVYINEVRAVRALDSASGKLLWLQPLPGRSEGWPVAAAGLVYVCCKELGQQPARIMALDGRTGRVVWSIAIPTEVGASPPAVTKEGLYVTLGNAVYALDPKTGRQKWRAATGELYGIGCPPSVYGSLLLVEYNGVLTAFDRQNGALKWELALPSRTAHIPVAVADGAAIVFCAGKGDLVAVDIANAESYSKKFSRGKKGR